MKVELIWGTDLGILQEEINNFIKDKKIIDIKYSSIGFSDGGSDSVLIMYDELKEKKK